MKALLMLAACAALLAGCGEKDQAKTAGNTNRSDVEAWKGTSGVYAVKGWSPGNKGSWENQVRARGQLQNEYVKAN
jgi:hypothetical protein